MTPNEQAIADLERQIKESQPALKLGKALASLSQNPEFKKIIIDGYLKNEAIRLVHLKADPSMGSPTSQAMILRDIDAVGSMEQYLRAIDVAGQRAERSITDAEQAIVEIQSEEK